MDRKYTAKEKDMDYRTYLKIIRIRTAVSALTEALILQRS